MEKLARKSERQQVLIRNIFDWTLCARRPLTLEELRKAVSIKPNDLSLDRSKIAAETDGKRFVQCCENLIQYSHNEGEITITHNTVAQFLEKYVLTRRLSEVYVGDICTTYLNFPDFESQVILAHEAQTMRGDVESRSALLGIPRILGIAGGVYDFLIGLYSRGASRRVPDIDYAELWKKYQRKGPGPPFDRGYPLLAYVQDHWLWHTRYYDLTGEGSEARWSRLEHLIFSKALAFDFRPWNNDWGSKQCPDLPMFI